MESYKYKTTTKKDKQLFEKKMDTKVVERKTSKKKWTQIQQTMPDRVSWVMCHLHLSYQLFVFINKTLELCFNLLFAVNTIIT